MVCIVKVGNLNINVVLLSTSEWNHWNRHHLSFLFLFVRMTPYGLKICIWNINVVLIFASESKHSNFNIQVNNFLSR